MSYLTTHAYDAMVWQLDSARGLVNFPDVQSWEEADFLALSF
jgi:hypothetical protein